MPGQAEAPLSPYHSSDIPGLVGLSQHQVMHGFWLQEGFKGLAMTLSRLSSASQYGHRVKPH